MSLEQVGRQGQKRLKGARVLIVGAGGLGSPAAMYLASAGVGTIGVVDHDKVDETNLQRQILFNTNDVGKAKAQITKRKLEEMNPNVNVIAHEEKLTSENALSIIEGYDVILDGSDNFPTKYLVNDACVLLKKPDVYGSILRFNGQSSVFNYQNGPCYRCLFPNPPPKDAVPTCAEAGVLGILPGVIGAIQATEAIKIMLGLGNILAGKLLAYDAINMSFKELNLRKNPECEVCGENPSVTKPIDYERFCNGNAGEKAEISAEELKQKLDGREDFELIDVREPFEREISKMKKSKSVPLSRIMKGDIGLIKDLDKNREIILLCHVGERSGYAARMLREKGYKNAKNLAGGINAWTEKVGREMRAY